MASHRPAAWRGMTGKTYGAGVPRVYQGTGTEWPATHGRGQYIAPLPRGSQRKNPRKSGENPRKEILRTRGHKSPERTRGDPRESPYAEHRTKRHWLGHVVDGDDRETATTSREGQGASAQGLL